MVIFHSYVKWPEGNPWIHEKHPFHFDQMWNHLCLSAEQAVARRHTAFAAGHGGTIGSPDRSGESAETGWHFWSDLLKVWQKWREIHWNFERITFFLTVSEAVIFSRCFQHSVTFHSSLVGKPCIFDNWLPSGSVSDLLPSPEPVRSTTATAKNRAMEATPLGCASQLSKADNNLYTQYTCIQNIYIIIYVYIYI